ncbi:MAG: TatD family hydrolase [Clostridia bacterium]|nr:TatD family hydrolase [Clostridia bacterium]
MLFDTHAHYDDSKFDKDRSEIIQKAFESGVGYILNASCNISSAVESISLSQQFEFVYAAIGVHPHNVEGMNENTIVTLGDFAQNTKVKAIGEIGLDYYYHFAPKEQQKSWFIRQIGLARNLRLPIIVHNRDAHEDSLKIIKNENAKEVGGVFHCFSGSVEMARELLNNNFYISVGGALTFKNAVKAVEVVKAVPMDRLLIETDCPYLTPEPHRGKRNDSSYVRFVAEKVAEIRGMTFDEVVEATTLNAKTLFKIH